MNSHEEKEVFDLIDQMQAEDFAGILAEVPVDRDMVIDDETKQRIKSRTFKKIGVRPVKSRLKRNLSLALAASLLVALFGTVAVGPGTVWAKLQRALQYIPGMNIVVEDKEKQMERYVLRSPVERKAGKSFMKIEGVVIEENQALVNITASFIHFKDSSVYFRNKEGQQLKLEFRGGSSDGTKWDGTFYYSGRVRDAEDLELVFAGEETIVFPLALEKAKSYSSYAEMGPTANVNGISITAIAAEENNQTKINLVSPPIEGARIDYYGLGHGSAGITLKDKNGRNYPVFKDSGFTIPLAEFYFDTGTAGTQDFILSIPYVGLVYYDEQETIKIDIPEQGMAKINKTVKLAGFPVDFEKIERLDKDTVRVHVDVHYDKKAKASLRGFNLDKQSWGGEMDEKTGALRTLEFDVASYRRSVALRLKEPLVIKQGPWEMNIKK